MRRRAFTLAEVLASIGIICILVGLLTPALRSVKRNAQVTSSISNLHQLHIALKLYQADWDGDGKYGSPTEMGMPWTPYEGLMRYGVDAQTWKSPCGKNPRWDRMNMLNDYVLYPMHVASPFKISDEAQLYRDRLPAFLDMNCTDDFEDLDNFMVSHRGLGVLLDGSLLTLRKPGSWKDVNWWVESPYGEQK